MVHGPDPRFAVIQSSQSGLILFELKDLKFNARIVRIVGDSSILNSSARAQLVNTAANLNLKHDTIWSPLDIEQIDTLAASTRNTWFFQNAPDPIPCGLCESVKFIITYATGDPNQEFVLTQAEFAQIVNQFPPGATVESQIDSNLESMGFSVVLDEINLVIAPPLPPTLPPEPGPIGTPQNPIEVIDVDQFDTTFDGWRIVRLQGRAGSVEAVNGPTGPFTHPGIPEAGPSQLFLHGRSVSGFARAVIVIAKDYDLTSWLRGDPVIVNLVLDKFSALSSSPGVTLSVSDTDTGQGLGSFSIPGPIGPNKPDGIFRTDEIINLANAIQFPRNITLTLTVSAPTLNDDAGIRLDSVTLAYKSIGETAVFRPSFSFVGNALFRFLSGTFLQNEFFLEYSLDSGMMNLPFKGRVIVNIHDPDDPTEQFAVQKAFDVNVLPGDVFNEIKSFSDSNFNTYSRAVAEYILVDDDTESTVLFRETFTVPILEQAPPMPPPPEPEPVPMPEPPPPPDPEPIPPPPEMIECVNPCDGTITLINPGDPCGPFICEPPPPPPEEPPLPPPEEPPVLPPPMPPDEEPPNIPPKSNMRRNVAIVGGVAVIAIAGILVRR